MELKYADLAVLASLAVSREGCLLCALVLEWYSFLRAVSNFVHHGLDQGERFFCGVWRVIIPRSRAAWESNQESRDVEVGSRGGG